MSSPALFLDDVIGTPLDAQRALEVFHWPSRAYAVARWRSDNRVYFAPDDLASVALLTLVEAVGRMEMRTWVEAWGYIKRAIDYAMLRAQFEDRNVGLRSIEEQENNPDDQRTALRVVQRIPIVHHGITERIAVMPSAAKAVLAARFFERMPMSQISHTLDLTPKITESLLVKSCLHVLGHAKQLASLTPPRELPKPIQVRTEQADTIRERAQSYASETYGCDVSSWLGWVQRSYEADVSYVLDMIDTAHGHGPKIYLPRVDRSGDVDHLDTLWPPPRSREDVATRTGWNHHRATQALREWRNTRGIETPKNGPAADALFERLTA